MAAGTNIVTAVIGTDFWVNILDKIVSLIIIVGILQVIPDRTKIKYSLGEKYAK